MYTAEIITLILWPVLIIASLYISIWAIKKHENKSSQN